jgi:hypothetical protein
MVISDIAQVEGPEVATIINAGTKYLATLAVLSTLRYAQIPTILINCDSKEDSFEWFQSLMPQYDFYLIQAPLKPHGETLDWIFKSVSADRVLLVDSDVEVLNNEMLSPMRAKLAHSPSVYGSGCLHTARWLTAHHCTDLEITKGIGYYMERPWIPFTLLRVAPVRTAISEGRSFMDRLVLNDVPQAQLISRALWKRFRIKFFRHHRLTSLDVLRRDYNGQKPCYVSYDTGADLHEFLTQQLRMTFEGVSVGSVPWSVRHFSGVTRALLSESPTSDTFKLQQAHPIVAARLREHYAISIDR